MERRMFDRKKIFEYASNNKRADKKVETMSDERMEAVIRWANYVRNRYIRNSSMRSLRRHMLFLKGWRSRKMARKR